MHEWDIEVRGRTQIPINKAYHEFTDPRQVVRLIPFCNGAWLISGEERKAGAVYGGLVDIGLVSGEVEIETTEVFPPSYAKVVLKRVLPPLSQIAQVKAEAALRLSENGQGCGVIFSSRGSIRGPVLFIPGFIDLLDAVIDNAPREALENLKTYERKT